MFIEKIPTPPTVPPPTVPPTTVAPTTVAPTTAPPPRKSSHYLIHVQTMMFLMIF